MNSLSYGIDWISATSTDPNVGERWYMEYVKYREETAPLFRENFSLQGGYLGERTEGFAWAYSKRYGFYIHGTGSTAMAVYPHIPGIGCKVTRIDLRVDVLLAKPDVDVAGKCYDPNKDAARPVYRLIDKSASGGQTLYIGSTSSDRFARLYDKSAERGQEAGWLWRYEVVVRKPHAGVLHQQIRESGIKAIPGLVWSWFADRSVPPAFDVDAIASIGASARAETVVERKLEWLRKSVQPSLARLIASGYAQEAFTALGISEPRNLTSKELSV